MVVSLLVDGATLSPFLFVLAQAETVAPPSAVSHVFSFFSRTSLFLNILPKSFFTYSASFVVDSARGCLPSPDLYTFGERILSTATADGDLFPFEVPSFRLQHWAGPDPTLGFLPLPTI